MNNQLQAICKLSPGFFDQDMRESLRSGMSSTLNFRLILSDLKGKAIRSNIQNAQLRYDIWEKNYHISIQDQDYQFSKLSKFEIFLYDSLKFSLGHIHNLAKQKKLKISILFSPQKITHSQQKKLNYWLTGAGETEESKPALESESGFSIDLSRLFSIFMRKKPSVKILKFHSQPFSIQGLIRNEISAQ